MKIRTGFVSNSSSSSFIAFGFKVNSVKEDEFFGEGNDETLWEWCENNDFVYYGEENIVGISVAEGIEESGVGSFDITKLPEYEARLSEIKNKIGDDEPLRLYYGTYSC